MQLIEDVANKTCITLRMPEVAPGSDGAVKNSLPNHVGDFVNQQSRAIQIARPKAWANENPVKVRKRSGIEGTVCGATGEGSGCA